MSGTQKLLRALGIAIALALIVASFLNFTTREKPTPMMRLDTPQASLVAGG